MAIGVEIAERLEFDGFRQDLASRVDCVELMSNGRAVRRISPWAGST